MQTVADLAAIRARFLSLWDSSIETVFENAEPVDVDETKGFVRFAINPSNTERQTIGDGVYRNYGRVWLQIFYPKAEGTTGAYELADAFTNIFRDWQSEDGAIRFHDGSDIKPIPDDEWFRLNVTLPYRSDRTL